MTHSLLQLRSNQPDLKQDSIANQEGTPCPIVLVVVAVDVDESFVELLLVEREVENGNVRR